jgi:hypothetical protein
MKQIGPDKRRWNFLFELSAMENVGAIAMKNAAGIWECLLRVGGA